MFYKSFLGRNYSKNLSKASGNLNFSGFTLIELIVVITIIGILATALLSLIDPAGQIQKARDAGRKSDLSQIQKTLEVYYSDNGCYPPSVSYQIVNGTTATPCSGTGGAAIAWGSQWPSIVTGGTPYMAVLPKDPSTTKKYVYYSPSGGQTYYLYASLDRGSKDPQVCTSGGSGVCSSLSANGISQNACGSANCNFGVSSSNTIP